MGVDILPKTVTRQRRGCDLNPGPSAPESSTLTTRLASVVVVVISAIKLLVPVQVRRFVGVVVDDLVVVRLIFLRQRRVERVLRSNITRLTAVFPGLPG